MEASLKRYKMLVVEDDPDISSGLLQYFEINGFEVITAADGEEALTMMARHHDIDVVLLDVMLPKKNGFDVLKESQELGVNAPVLMLTGRGEQELVLKGFGLGANDYVIKPFNVDELAMRVRAILYRTQPPNRAPMEIYTVGDVRVNFSTHEAFRGDEKLPFTALEFDILKYLIHSRDRIVTRKQLLRDVWGIEQEIITRTIDRHVASLRKKLERDLNNPEHIETVYGIGYRFRG